MKNWLLLIFAFFISASAHADETIRFSVPNFPPYAYYKDGKIEGTAIDLLNKILPQTNIPYELELTETYGRALHNITSGKSDGMFLATQNDARDEVAVFSAPVTFNNWVWYVSESYEHAPTSPQFRSSARIGTILATNTHKWLANNGYNVTAPPPNIEHLLKMFMKGHYDAVFIAEKVFEHEAEQRKLSVSKFKKYAQVKLPFGVYLAKHYIKKYPDSMNKINEAIHLSYLSNSIKDKSRSKFLSNNQVNYARPFQISQQSTVYAGNSTSQINAYSFSIVDPNLCGSGSQRQL